MDDCPPTEVEVLQSKVSQLILDLQQARETNRRLNRRIGRLQHHIHSDTTGRALRRANYWANFYSSFHNCYVKEWRAEHFARYDLEKKLANAEIEIEVLKSGLPRDEVIWKVFDEGRLTVTTLANALGISYREAHKLSVKHGEKKRAGAV